MNTSEILIRFCKVRDIREVIQINKYWQRNMLKGDLSRGFVSGELNKDYLKEVIQRGEIVVAVESKYASVIGYYMINDVAHSPDNYAKILEMLEKDFLDKDVRVGLAAQAAIDVQYQGLGVKELMIQTLVIGLRENYDIMVSSIYKINKKSMLAHQNKGGWKVFDEDEQHIYIFYNLHNNNHRAFFTKKLNQEQ